MQQNSCFFYKRGTFNQILQGEVSGQWPLKEDG